jgi:putative selenate reductase molybdopterin-binding subunit
VALVDRHTGTSLAATKVQLNPTGRLKLTAVIADVGPGVHTMMLQVASEVLQVEPDTVEVVQESTDAFPWDQGVKGMSATLSSGTAAFNAARNLTEALCLRAAAEWGVSRDHVRWEDGGVTLQDDSGRSGRMDLVELARLAPDDPAVGAYTFDPSHLPDTLSFQTAVAEVAVDPETGEVSVERLTTVHDVGTVYNPTTHQGQIEGGLAQGFGWSVMEDLAIEEGRVHAGSLGDYKLPTICDIPPITTAYVNCEIGPAPWQAKGIAESGISSVAPAIANAVFDATGVRITSIPITAENVLAGLRAKQATAPALAGAGR